MVSRDVVMRRWVDTAQRFKGTGYWYHVEWDGERETPWEIIVFPAEPGQSDPLGVRFSEIRRSFLMTDFVSGLEAQIAWFEDVQKHLAPARTHTSTHTSSGG